MLECLELRDFFDAEVESLPFLKKEKNPRRSTPDFASLFTQFMKSKQHRRPRTKSELRSIIARILRHEPELEQRPVWQIEAEDCENILNTCFHSIRQRRKAYMILHAIFAYAKKKRLCRYNPVEELDKPQLRESEIIPLSWGELQALFFSARKAEHQACLPPLALMLWAGIRPAEMARLEWAHIDWFEKVIIIPARHAKTGGCRHIELRAVMHPFLDKERRQGLICPPDWQRRWKRLRQAAGLIPWRQDVLRHTFASYHVKKWHNFPLLQAEMGHRSAELLRTRYLSMQGMEQVYVASFWRPGAL